MVARDLFPQILSFSVKWFAKQRQINLSDRLYLTAPAYGGGRVWLWLSRRQKKSLALAQVKGRSGPRLAQGRGMAQEETDALAQEEMDALAQEERDVLAQEEMDALAQEEMDALAQVDALAQEERDVLAQLERDVLAQLERDVLAQ